jgi:hypothetical protein
MNYVNVVRKHAESVRKDMEENDFATDEDCTVDINNICCAEAYKESFLKLCDAVIKQFKKIINENFEQYRF